MTMIWTRDEIDRLRQDFPGVREAMRQRVATQGQELTPDMLRQLRPGDVVEHRATGELLVIVINYGLHALAVQAREVTHPDEWRLVRKASDPAT
jgi:hypothetical protein